MDELQNARRIPNRVVLLENMPRGGVCAEIGVFRGAFARKIFDTLQPSKLFLIDPWQQTMRWKVGDTVEEFTGEESHSAAVAEFAAEIESGRVELIRGASPDALSRIRGPLDFVYIDGDHRFDAVLADLEGVFPLMRPGGWICGDDYCEIFNFGVPRAVAVFCARHRLQVGLLTNSAPAKTIGSKIGANSHVSDWVAFNSFAIQLPAAEAGAER